MVLRRGPVIGSNTPISHKEEKMTFPNSQSRKQILVLLLAACSAIFNASSSLAAEEKPFFAGSAGAPNIMIILDNSDSMQDSPYLRDNHIDSFRPYLPWRTGPKVAEDCDQNPATDDGPCLLDYTPGVPDTASIATDPTMYTTDVNMTLPGVNPPNVPGTGSTSSTVTKFENKKCVPDIPGKVCSLYIHDNKINWAPAGFNENDFYKTYRYWPVEIKDTTTGATQLRYIRFYYADAGGRWSVFGGDIVYDTANEYTYTFLAGSPGQVTSKDFLITDEENKRYLVDRNIDWSQITSGTYSNRVVEFLDGPNKGERRGISGFEGGWARWTLASKLPFLPTPNDRYRVIGTPEDDIQAGYGDHPASKMYQAKSALQKFFDSGSIKTCTHTDTYGNCDDWQYFVNFGFATYLQAVVPTVRALYYQYHPEETKIWKGTFRFKYRWNLGSGYTRVNLNGCTTTEPHTPLPTQTFLDSNDVLRTNVPVGPPGFVEERYVGSCWHQFVYYVLDSVVCEPKDFYGGRAVLQVSARTTDPKNGTDPDGHPQAGQHLYQLLDVLKYDPPPALQPGPCKDFPAPAQVVQGTSTYNLVGKTEQCWEECIDTPPSVEIKKAYYSFWYFDTWGDLRITNPASPGYINKNPGPGQPPVTPYQERYGYTIVPVGGMTDVPIDVNGTIVSKVDRVVYDNSQFVNPGRSGDADHPHGWSYKRTANNNTGTTPIKNNDGVIINDQRYMFMDETYVNQVAEWSKWGDDVQESSSYFPSTGGNSSNIFSNFDGDNQAAFVDLPAYVEGAPSKGDDVTGQNVQKIKELVNLSRPRHPFYSAPQSANPDKRLVNMAPLNPGSISVNTVENSGQGTPIAASLLDAKRYFQSYIAQDPYSQDGCRQNYIVLVTDGRESCGGDPIAAAQALQNMTYNGKPTPVNVYVVGFGMDKSLQAELNALAAAGGTSQAYFANNVDDLARVLSQDITSEVLKGSYSRAKIALSANNRENQKELSLYYGYFDYPVWRGHLMSFDLDPKTGAVKASTPHWAKNCAGSLSYISEPGDPDAGCFMAEKYLNAAGVSPLGPADTDRRTLYTTVSGSRQLFRPDQVDILKNLVNPGNLDINQDGIVNDQDAKDVINYVHHPGYDNPTFNVQKYQGTRDPRWPLGDIFSSGPVLVTAPVIGECGTSVAADGWKSMMGYCEFRNKTGVKDRPSMLYVGSNGGMIEAIVADNKATGEARSGGEEKWGYLPNNVLGKINEFKVGHRFTMDLPIQAGEVDTSDGLVGDDHAGNGWKTMLVAGQRKGGSYYTALDVTDPADPKPMWEFTDPKENDPSEFNKISNLGQTWSTPSFGRIMINGVKTSVVFFGGGYSPDENVGNRLYILRARDGALVKEITVGNDPSNDVPGNLRTMRYLTDYTGTVVDYRTNLPKLPNGNVVDYSARENFIEVIYFGDTNGSIWRLHNLNTDAAPENASEPFGPPWSNNVSLTLIYTPEDGKKMPIYYRPVAYDRREGSILNGVVTGCVRRYIVAGTGNEQDPTAITDGSNAVLNYAFEIEDREFNVRKNDTGHLPPWSSNGTDGDKELGRFRLNWRLTLGLSLPQDTYGFLKDNTGAKVKKNGLTILNSETLILKWSDYSVNEWSIVGGDLYKAGGIKVANAQEFLIKHDTGSPHHDNGLYDGPAIESTLVAADGTYFVRKISLWFTDENGWFYDTDGTPLIDTKQFFESDGTLLATSPYITAKGEKALSEFATQTGNVYFTTYSPVGGCAKGSSFFYGFKISDCSKLGGEGVIEQAGYPRRHNARISLGEGLASPVAVGGDKAYVITPGEDHPTIDTFDIPSDDAGLLFWRQD
jgi:hypothetical protein